MPKAVAARVFASVLGEQGDWACQCVLDEVGIVRTSVPSVLGSQPVGLQPAFGVTLANLGQQGLDQQIAPDAGDAILDLDRGVFVVAPVLASAVLVPVSVFWLLPVCPLFFGTCLETGGGVELDDAPSSPLPQAASAMLMPVMSASLRVWGVMRKISFDGVLQGSSGHCVRITTPSMEASGRAVGVFGQDPGKTGRGYSGSRDA